ncbi:hypothetical protein [Deinococcus ficus]|uniref:Uncharacterized protein n=1 Tax=Deinococcus ficus TaxID=317577 RepID=A0A221T2T0_9DEIO|nr:hypothetical protein [Deinococcus ficus]ASN83171.1 hypothetical protein DFI_18395 [Deinococcus ficus]
MSKESLSTFVSFVLSQQPQVIYVIPDEDQSGVEIDVLDSQRMASLDKERDFRKVPFADLALGRLIEADEQAEVDGLIVTTRDGRYLIPYARD